MSPDCAAGPGAYVWRAPRAFASCRGAEPALDQLLADPLIRLVMRSDGVAEADIRALARPRRRRDEASS